ncbi:uncharacterized protein DS421_1g27850 [Arachis hypogaea]|nr:uncharacterized protein DS421_1g27850 [Arachis hypogaea]
MGMGGCRQERGRRKQWLRLKQKAQKKCSLSPLHSKFLFTVFSRFSLFCVFSMAVFN